MRSVRCLSEAKGQVTEPQPVCMHEHDSAGLSHFRGSMTPFLELSVMCCKHSLAVLPLPRRTSARPSKSSRLLRCREGNPFAQSNPAGSTVEGGLPESMPGSRSRSEESDKGTWMGYTNQLRVQLGTDRGSLIRGFPLRACS